MMKTKQFIWKIRNFAKGKRWLAGLLLLILAFNLLPTAAFATEQNTDDIVILYENDVHCAVEGYSKLAALKNELQETYRYVGVVSGGDYVQGNSLGAISKGEYIVKLMNLVGYDAVALGNHEFDYRLDRLEELVGMMDTKPVCSNFQKLGEDASYFEPYSIVSYGDVKIAYIGITTPSTITSSSPAQFKDENGNFTYSFNASTLYEVVQNNIDAAKNEGADYIIALSHIGYAEDELYGDWEDVETLIKNTDGFDVVLDAHSHSVIQEMEITDKGNNKVLLSSTGTKFAHIGKLTISEDGFKTELIKVAEYQNTDPLVDAYLEQINREYATLGDRKVAVSAVDLITKDANGNRLVRNTETNLGNLCADAIRYAGDADIGYVNGGGIRADISKGDVTFNDLLSAHPFNNTVVVAQISGQTLKDMMEMAVMSWPAEDGSFPHLSGIRFSVNKAIPSSVVLNEFGEFTGVSGEYRVYAIEVFNKETNEYEPISLTKQYTLAAFNYFLLEYGSGMTMLKDAKIILNEGMLDIEALERYVVEALGGTIGEAYAQVNPHITFTDGKTGDNGQGGGANSPQTGDHSDMVIQLTLAAIALSFLLASTKATARKR